MTTAISVRNLTKTYGTGEAAVHALTGVDLDVRRGEVLLMMGPSGSGKTTLLQVMGCILRPTSGSVRIAGRDVAVLPEKALPAVRLQHIGFVFQGFNLFPTLSAGENLELALDLKGIRGKRARVLAADLLAQVEMEGKYSVLPSNLSGGQKQRIAIARALAGDPEIVLADEPTAALDSHSGRLVMDLLRRLARERDRAIVVVTHDDRTLSYADRIVHMEDGEILEGAPAGHGFHDAARVATDQ